MNTTTTITLSAASLSEKARAREAEVTGTDPGSTIYRLHRSTCDRLGTTVNVDLITGDLIAEHAEGIRNAKPCTRCKPRATDLEAVREYANANEPTPEPEATPEPEPTPAPKPQAKVPANIGDVAVIAGPAATVRDGRILALTASRYPEVEEDAVLHCATDDERLPAGKFAFVTKRGAGDGRMVECRKHFEERLAANKTAKAAGQPVTKAPRIADEHIVPKG